MKTEEKKNARTVEEADPESRVYAVYVPAGWQTPQARDVKGGCNGGRIRNGRFSAGGLDQMAQLIETRPQKTAESCPTETPEILGLTLVGSIAGTTKSARLNPAFSRWLMGFPKEWDYCGVMAMRSFRK